MTCFGSTSVRPPTPCPRRGPSRSARRSRRLRSCCGPDRRWSRGGWLREVDGARRSGPVIIGRADDVEPPSYARDLPVVELTPWRADGNALALEPLAGLILEIASRTLDPRTSEASADAPMARSRRQWG